MTLILTVANTSGVYQSSDYQLTDMNSGAPLSDRAGSKQLQATFKGTDLQIAFTGVAEVGTGTARQRTVDHLSSALKTLPHDSSLQDICDALSQRITTLTAPLKSRGIVHVVLTAATVGKAFRVAEVSNVDWRRYPPEAKSRFTIRIHLVTKPFHLISGYRDAVPISQQFRLQALARGAVKPAGYILDALADINASAAKNGKGYISEGCWVTSQIGDGRARRTVSRNVGKHLGGIPMVHGGLDLNEFVQGNFRPAPGDEIRLVQSAGVIAGPGDAIPTAAPKGSPRRIAFAGSSVADTLRSPAGPDCASIKISQMNCLLELRCNEEVTIPFARILLDGISPISQDFPRPLLPWPQLKPSLTVEAAEVPRGWEYSIGYWIENNTHHVVVPQSSRSVRNLGFLEPDEEIVIVAPSSTLEFAWRDGEPPPSATVDGRISWRTRPDGTRG